MQGEIQLAPTPDLKEISTAGKSLPGLRAGIGFYRTIIRTLPDLIWLKDVDGVYLACNHRFENFVGATDIKSV